MSTSAGPATDPQGAFPLLDASGDEHSLDWPEAEYSATVAGSAGHWRVRHRLSGAPGVTDLVEAGDAMYAAEVRCPRTLFSELAYSRDPVTDLRYPEAMVRAPVFVVPGVIAVADCRLSTNDTAVIWRDADSEVPVRRGAWLVRGRAVKEDLACSLLVFETVDELADHEMGIRPYEDQDGNTRLKISIPPIQEPRLSEEAFVAQAWQAALAYLPYCNEFSLEQDAASSNAFVGELEVKLSGMPLWGEDERPSWDPLRAATRLLGMPTPTPDGDEG